MTALQLPEKVVQSWGQEVAQDFLAWLDLRLQAAQLPANVRVSAFSARQQVNVLMLERVSNLLLASEPWLVQSESGEWWWRVPIDLTYPNKGRVGRVGVLDVDANLGLVIYTEQMLEAISSEAAKIAKQWSHNQSEVMRLSCN